MSRLWYIYVVYVLKITLYRLNALHLLIVVLHYLTIT